MYFVSREKNEIVLKLLAIKNTSKRIDHSMYSPGDSGLTSLDLMDWTGV